LTQGELYKPTTENIQEANIREVGVRIQEANIRETGVRIQEANTRDAKLRQKERGSKGELTRFSKRRQTVLKQVVNQLIYKEILMGSGATSYMTNGILRYD
jgi:hypothetical protein